MSYIISASVIENLDHNLDEIRIRTLKHVEGKILRALQQGAPIEFLPGKLICKLIGWFNRKPLFETETVLNLIFTILKSEYIHQTIKYIKKAQLEKEINKIYEIVKDSPMFREIVLNIQKEIRSYKEVEDNYVSSSSNTPISGNSLESISIKDINLEKDDFYGEYEIPWSTPSMPDANNLNTLFTSTSTTSTFEEIKNGLIYLKTAVNDYPFEYFLQPPYIFKNLVKIYLNEKSFAKLLIPNFKYLCESALARIKKRVMPECYDPSWKEILHKKTKTQITISKFCVEILKICVDHLKEFGNNNDENTILEIYELMTAIFHLMKLKEFVKNLSVAPFKSIFIDLGILARYYRLEKNSRFYRIQYILIIYIISKLAQELAPYMKIKNDDFSILYEKTSSSGQYGDSSEIWLTELQYTILDFPLRYFHQKIYFEVEKAIEVNDIKNDKIITILKCEEYFKPAADLLKSPKILNNEGFITLASRSMETLSIHKSQELVMKTIRVITESMNLFDGNTALKKLAEDIILRLIAHENLTIKRRAYKEISANMKNCFGALMSGDFNYRSFHNQFDKPKTLGIPFTTDIIMEIICFGCSNDDISIKKNAEIILSLILKSRDILKENWKYILEILSPNFPLLQSLASYKSDLGKLIFDLFNPDVDFENFEIFKANIRFLFSNEKEIRSEAITRLAYILTNEENHKNFLPNIYEIFDTIPDNICSIGIPRDTEKIFYGGIYDATTIPALLELLKSDDVEPSIRKTCLMQLNVLCQDIDLNKKIFGENGWFHAIQILENSLKKNPQSPADYPDSVIPAISMLCKILLCNSFFRKELSNESSIYVLLMRALFLFYNDITLQQDAVVTLFLLLYSHQIIGSEKILSIPKILKVNMVPLKCDFHWEESSNTKISEIEKIYLDLSNTDEAPVDVKNFGATSVMLNEATGKYETYNTLNSCITRRSEPIYSVAKPKVSYNGCSIVLEFFRYSFANCWFFNLSTVCKQSKTLANNSEILDYFPVNENEKIAKMNGEGDSNNLEFSNDLKLKSDDIRLIKFTDPCESVKKYFKKTVSATTVFEFLKNLTSLRFCYFLTNTQDSSNSNHLIDGKELTKAFQRYMTIKPISNSDYQILENVIEFYNVEIKNKNEDIILWLLNDFLETNCLVLQILKDYNIHIPLYDCVCKLIENVVKFCSSQDNHNNRIQELIISRTNGKNDQESETYNLYNKLFEYLIPISEECFHKRNLNQLRSLSILIEIISEKKDLDMDLAYANIIIKKFMYFVMALKMFHQSGSHLIKNCLLIVCNMMNNLDELILEPNYIKLLSGLCGHEDFEVRILAWCILTKMSENLQGAHLIVTELSKLPGGFHACSLSTLLDRNETPMVRSVAGFLFANLLAHKIKNSDGQITLHLSVVPLCIEMEPSIENNGIKLINEIFKKHSFYSGVLNSIEYIYLSKVNECFTHDDLTTPEIMSSYCRILSNFITLSQENFRKNIETEPFMIRIFSLVKLIPGYIRHETIVLLCEICHLINKTCGLENFHQIKKNLCSDYGFIVALLQLIDLRLIANNGKKEIFINVLQTLKILINETVSFEIICDILESSGVLNFIEIFRYGFENSKSQDFQNASLTLFTTLFVKSDSFTNSKYRKIADMFDEAVITEKSNQNLSGSELIFIALKGNLLQVFQKRKDGLLLRKTLICEAIAILLRTSQKVKKFAHKDNFLSTILDQINSIFENIPTTCTEFIRKYGDMKKDFIIQELTILYSIIMHWFCSDCLTNDYEIEKLTKIILRTWQWISHSESLREIFLKTLAILSENSIKVCKFFSYSITSFANSIVQLTAKMVIAETNKIKHPNLDFSSLELGLGILSNCCNCIEGRLLLVKINILDVIDQLYPIESRTLKSWTTVTLYWLEFWNIFSQHEEGAVLKNLYILCAFIAKAKSNIKIMCLQIIRNMAFVPVNRPALLASQDFQYITKEILENGNEEEKYIIIITLWQLGAGNFKARHALKSWGIPGKLKKIQNEIDTTDKENDFNSAIDIVLQILK